MTTLKKPEWFFYPAWIILPALCIPIAFALYFATTRIINYFSGDINDVNGIFIIVPLFGLLTGLLQYGLLRRYLPRMGYWIPATLLGWSLGLLLSFGLLWARVTLRTAEALNESWVMNVSFILLGLSIGLAQWLLLRRRLPRTGWWIVVNVGVWSLIALITGETLGLFSIMAMSLLPGCVTAVALAMLMNQTPPLEPQHV